MVKLVWTEEAFESLKSIHAYLSELNAETALQTIQGIYAQAEILKPFPHLGYRHDEKEGVERRFLLYGHYRILYGVEEGRVSVLGVFHAARDLDLAKL